MRAWAWLKDEDTRGFGRQVLFDTVLVSHDWFRTIASLTRLLRKSASHLCARAENSIANMKHSPDTMDELHDEKIERGSGTLEVGLGTGEDSKEMRSVVFKMDVRFVTAVILPNRFVNSVTNALLGFCQSSRSYSSAPSSTERTSETQRS